MALAGSRRFPQLNGGWKILQKGQGHFFIGEGNQMQNGFDYLTLEDAKSIMPEIIILD